MAAGFFLLSEASFGFQEFAFRPRQRLSLRFSFLSSQTPQIRSTLPSAITHHGAPLEQRPCPNYCQCSNVGIVSPRVFITVPSLHLHSACFWYLGSVSVCHLGFEGETNLAVYTIRGFSDEHSLMIALRSSKSLEKMAYLGGGGWGL